MSPAKKKTEAKEEKKATKATKTSKKKVEVEEIKAVSSKAAASTKVDNVEGKKPAKKAAAKKTDEKKPAKKAASKKAAEKKTEEKPAVKAVSSKAAASTKVDKVEGKKPAKKAAKTAEEKPAKKAASKKTAAKVAEEKTAKKTVAKKAAEKKTAVKASEEKPAKKAAANKAATKKAAEKAVEEKPAKKTAAKKDKSKKDESAKAEKAEKTAKTAKTGKTGKKKADVNVNDAAETADSAPAKEKPVKKAPSKRTAAKRATEAVEAAQSNILAIDPAVEPSVYANKAVESPQFVKVLVDNLASNVRRDRQYASVVVSQISKKTPELLVEYIPSLVVAAKNPEAQTRWEVLEALKNLIPLDFAACKKVINAAEDCLYDDKNGSVRLAAFSFLCAIGAVDSRTSKRVWPTIDDGIQCYHGDLEFQDMLSELVDFASGKIAGEVKKELAARMKFDADNANGLLKRKAIVIVSLCTSKKK